jgi:hypothetical protein
MLADRVRHDVVGKPARSRRFARETGDAKIVGRGEKATGTLRVSGGSLGDQQL